MADQSAQPAAKNAMIRISESPGNLATIQVKTPWSTAEIYRHGAHVTQFRKNGEKPVLFLSGSSRFVDGQPIRGGIPVIFPWFGPREGAGLHGFARIKTWELVEQGRTPGGGAQLRFRLPNGSEAAAYPPFTAEYIVTVSETLALELVVTNQSKAEAFEFEECLHTYFSVDDISAVSITGLQGASYLDKVAGFEKKTERAAAIRLTSEVDRVYLDTTSPVEIHDAQWKRTIRVEKEHSASTVVWNPWIDKARQLPDFGDGEYRQMVCVESGNVASNKIVLPPGKTSRMKVTLKVTNNR